MTIEGKDKNSFFYNKFVTASGEKTKPPATVYTSECGGVIMQSKLY
jgi:hypothetical protein